jgi:hypothetical protein
LRLADISKIIDRSECLCKKCTLGKVEDKLSLIIECTVSYIYDTIRDSLSGLDNVTSS